MEFPDNVIDLIGLFLDRDIRQARAQMYREIERGTTDELTRTVAKGVVTLHAIQAQAGVMQQRGGRSIQEEDNVRQAKNVREEGSVRQGTSVRQATGRCKNDRVSTLCRNVQY